MINNVSDNMPVSHPMFPQSPSSINIHNFSLVYNDRNIQFQVTKLTGQTLIWIGEGSNSSLATLAAAVPVADCPSTTLLGGNEQSTRLAGNLAKKLKKQVFMSYNLEDDMLTTPMVLERLIEEIKVHPEMF